MDAESKSMSLPRIAGLAIDFLVVGVPILLTVIVAGVITVAILPEFSLAALGGAAILGAVRWLNCRDDEQRRKRYIQVPTESSSISQPTT